MSKQKAKGSAYEREVAKFLSELYGHHFMRNQSGSGAYIGGKNFHRAKHLSEDQLRNTRGDIAVPPEFHLLNVECKHHADFGWHLLFGEHKQLDGWLDQMTAVAEERSVNLLAFKITRRGNFVAVEDGPDLRHDFSHSIYRDRQGRSWLITDFLLFFRHNKAELEARCRGSQT